MASATSFPMWMCCRCLEISLNYPESRRSPRSIDDRVSSSTHWQNLMRAHQVLKTLQTGRSPRSQCILYKLSPTSSRQYGRRISLRDPYGCQNWTPWMRTTTAPSGRPRWEPCNTSSHRHERMMDSSSALLWSYQWYGWNYLSSSVPPPRHWWMW